MAYVLIFLAVILDLAENEHAVAVLGMGVFLIGVDRIADALTSGGLRGRIRAGHRGHPR